MNLTHELSTSPNSASNSTNYTPVTTYIYYVAYSINIILGLPVHSYVLWLICSGKGSGIVPEFFSLNLTVCEILFSLGSAVFIAAMKFPTLVHIIFFFVAQPSTARPLINCVICIERYLAVLYPVTFLRYKPLRYRLACSAVIWVTVLALAMFCRFILLSNNMYVFLCVYLPLYSVLLFIKSFCSIAIFRALNVSGPGEKGNEHEEANHIKRKAMTVILIITAAMFIQYTPIYLIGIFYRTLSAAQFQLYWCIGTVIAMIMAYVSPLLYIHRIRSL